MFAIVCKRKPPVEYYAEVQVKYKTWNFINIFFKQQG